MNRSRRFRMALGIALAGWAGASGCTHNYYYTMPGCSPGGETVTTQVGQMGDACDVPSGQIISRSDASSGTIVQSPTRRSAQAAPAGGSRVVISQPGYSPQSGRGAGNRLAGWRRPDPDSQAVTRVEGALDSPSVIR